MAKRGKKKKSKAGRRRQRRVAKKSATRRRRRRSVGKIVRRRRRRRVARANPGAAKKAAPKKAKKKSGKKGKKKSTRLLRSMRSKPRGRTKRVASAAIKRIKKLRPAERRRAEALGFLKGSRKNPGGVVDFVKQEASDLMALVPDMAVQFGSMAAIGYVGSMATDQIKKMVRGVEADGKTPKAEPKDSFVYNYAGVISTSVLTLAAFTGAKMMKSEKVQAYSLPILFGGMAATIVQLLAAVKVKKDEKDSTEISLGQKLGLPIGDYMSLNGFIDVHGARVAVDGFGDYIPQALGDISLSPGPFSEGTVVSMGDYVPQALGSYDLHRTIEGTVLGEIGQMSEGRQGARALGAPGDQTVESFIDGGVLSGSVFD